MNVDKVVLEGTSVRLEPLTPQHEPGLASAIRDGALWKIPFTIIPHPDQLAGFLSAAETAFDAGRELAFATIDKATNMVAGSTRFRCIESHYRRVEIGFTFLAQSHQRSALNTEAKLLMLQHAFDSWGFNRVELLTDVLNDKSRSAIARLGATQEGILRSHMVMRDGRVRDSVVYSIIRSEWPALSEALRTKLRD